MADSRTLEVIINGQDNLSKALGSASKGLGSFGFSMQNSIDASQRFAAGLTVAAAGLAAFGVVSLQSADEAEAAQTRLATLFLNVKGATEAQLDALTRLADEQMRKTTLDDESIKSGLGQLATFQLQADTIAGLTPGMNDLAVSLYGVTVNQDQMKDVGNLLGKAMSGNTSVLQRYGIVLDENQQQVLKTGTETEKMAVLVGALEGRFGGLAARMRNTTSGEMQAMKNSVGEMQESIGKLLQPAVRHVTSAIQRFADALASFDWDHVRRMWEEYEVPITIAAGAIVGALVPAIYSAVVSVGALVIALAPFMVAGGALTALVLVIRKAWEENWGGIQEKTAAVIAFLTPLFDNLKLVFEAAWEGIKLTIQAVMPIIKAIVEHGFGGLLDTVKSIWESISSTVKFYWTLLSDIIGVAINLFKGNWGAAWEGVKKIIEDVWNNIKDTVSGFIDPLIQKMNDLISLWNKVRGIGQELDSSVPEYGGGVAKPPKPQKKAMGGLVLGMGNADTVHALLTPGEEVLRRDNPRHILNGGGGQSIVVNISGPFYGDDRQFAEKIGNSIVAKLRPTLAFARAT